MTDPELQDLLDDLESEEQEEQPVAEESVVVDVEKPKPAEPEVDTDEESATQLIQQKKSAVPAPTVDLDLSKIINDHEGDYRTAMSNLRNDRTKIDQVVSKLMKRLDDNSCKAADVEGLVRSLDTLTNSSMCIVRLMDSRSKLIAALRGHMVGAKVQGGTTEGSEGQLAEMLEQPNDDV